MNDKARVRAIPLSSDRKLCCCVRCRALFVYVKHRYYRDAGKSLARPGRKQATATKL